MDGNSPIPPDARRLSIPTVRLSTWLDGFADRHGSVETSAVEHHVIVSAADGSVAWIEVPFPPLAVEAGRVLASLLAHVGRPRRIGVLLVRRGGYAAGVFDDADLISSKVGSVYVQGGTKAGGWSQQRFARRRANQARSAFEEAADTAVRILLPEHERLAAVFCGGDRAAVRSVLADSRLAALQPLIGDRFLTVPDPRLRVLRETPSQFLTVPIAIHP